MKYFTRSPLERLMMRLPTVQVRSDFAPPVPKSYPCYGCKRRNESAGCVLPCYRGVERMPPQ